MKKNLLLLLVLSLLLGGYSCKKSENDPAFSLKSRHKRACGEWKMKKGSLTSTYVDKNNASSSVNYTLTESGFSAVIPSKGTIVGNFSLKLSMLDDDTFTLIQEFGAAPETTKGKWQFLKRTSDYKNKERLSFSHDANTITSGDLFSFSKGGFSYVYTIDELSNDNKMVLVCEKELVLAEASNGAADKFYITARYELEQ